MLDSIREGRVRFENWLVGWLMQVHEWVASHSSHLPKVAMKRVVFRTDLKTFEVVLVAAAMVKAVDEEEEEGVEVEGVEVMAVVVSDGAGGG